MNAKAEKSKRAALPAPLALDVATASEVLNVSLPTLYDLMYRDDHPIPHLRVGKSGRRILIPYKGLMEWLEGETKRQMVSEPYIFGKVVAGK